MFNPNRNKMTMSIPNLLAKQERKFEAINRNQLNHPNKANDSSVSTDDEEAPTPETETEENEEETGWIFQTFMA